VRGFFLDSPFAAPEISSRNVLVEFAYLPPQTEEEMNAGNRLKKLSTTILMAGLLTACGQTEPGPKGDARGRPEHKKLGRA